MALALYITLCLLRSILGLSQIRYVVRRGLCRDELGAQDTAALEGVAIVGQRLCRGGTGTSAGAQKRYKHDKRKECGEL